MYRLLLCKCVSSRPSLNIAFSVISLPHEGRLWVVCQISLGMLQRTNPGQSKDDSFRLSTQIAGKPCLDYSFRTSLHNLNTFFHHQRKWCFGERLAKQPAGKGREREVPFFFVRSNLEYCIQIWGLVALKRQGVVAEKKSWKGGQKTRTPFLQDRLRELGSSALRRLQCNINAAFQNVKGAYKQNGEQFFMWTKSEETSGDILVIVLC